MTRFVRPLLGLAALLLAVPALAATGWLTYSQAGFARAQGQNRTIVVDVYATWCSTCRAQEPALEALRSEPRLRGAIFVKVDFDREKAFLQQHRIAHQSTVLVFSGRRETARSVGETRPQELRAAVLAGL